MEWLESSDYVFNGHKIKYIELDKTFNFEENKKKNTYVFIDLDYLLKKFLYSINYYENKDVDLDGETEIQFIVGLLNLIAHYKNYFYNKHDCLSFYYIFINNKKYKSNEKINNLVKFINKILLMVPRIYTIYYEKDDQAFYLKYNLMNKINLIKDKNDEQCFYINIGNDDKNELLYRINKNLYQLIFENYKPRLYTFDEFRKYKLDNVPDIFINSVLALLPVYVILDELKICNSVKIDDVIMKYIKTHMNENFNDPKVHLLVLKMFTSMRKLQNKLIKLEENLNSLKYNTIIEVIMNNWKHIIKDRNIIKINEMYKIPNNRRIMIETLVNC